MKRPWDFFITGTDTNVGKTVVTAALLAALRARGVDAVAMKPVQTGSRRDRSADLDYCARVTGWRFSRAELEDLCAYRFRLPASPHLAAAVENREVDPELIADAFENLRAGHEAVLVEGAGGLLVPLTAGLDQTHLIRRLGLAAIVVARAGLGTLNHTLLTVEALRARDIPLAAVVLSSPRDNAGVIASDNLRFLARKLRGVRVMAFPPVRRGRFQEAGALLLAGLRRRVGPAK